MDSNQTVIDHSEYNTSDKYKDHRQYMSTLHFADVIERHLCIDDPAMAYAFINRSVPCEKFHGSIDVPTDIEELLDKLFVIYYVLAPREDLTLFIEWYIVNGNICALYDVNKSLRDNLRPLHDRLVLSYVALYRQVMEKLNKLLVNNTAV